MGDVPGIVDRGVAPQLFLMALCVMVFRLSLLLLERIVIVLLVASLTSIVQVLYCPRSCYGAETVVDLSGTAQKE
jgi:hypothetical protein